MSQQDVGRKLEAFLQQCQHFDKDQRYMAVSDMSNILSQNVRLDVNLEKKIGDQLCKLFDDKSVDVQSIAVKTVSVLVGGKTCQEKTVVDVFAYLCKKMLSRGEDPTIRSLYAIGLKTCILSVDDANTVQVVCSKVVPSLVEFANRDVKSAEVQDSLEVLNDLLAKSRHCGGMDRFHAELIQMAIAQLSRNPNALVRKRAISMLGVLSVLCSDALLTSMVESVMKIGGIETVLAIGAIGREAGSRLGHYVDKLVPLLVSNLKTPQDSGMQTATGDEHREFIFQALESFIVRCPLEMEKHLDALLKEKCFVFLKYDPNWNDDGEMSEVEGGEDEEEDGEDGYSDMGDEDDDDSSWKVRRACAKLLHSLISSRSDAVNRYFAQLEQLLQDRSCKERVESVRLDVLEAYKSLLDATVLMQAAGTTLSAAGPVPLVRQRSDLGQLLLGSFPVLVRNLTKLLKQTKQPKSKIAIVQVITKVVQVLGGKGLDSSKVDGLLPLVLQNVKDRNANLKLESLLLIKTLVGLEATGITLQHLQQIKPAVLKCVDADWFKVVSEALKCVSALCGRWKRLGEDKDGAQLLNAIMPRLRQADIDLEIKNCAIDAAGQIVSCFTLTSDLDKQTLQILLDRVKNESSRIAALRAFERIANTVPPKREFASSAAPLLAVELVALLRQQSRDVRQHTLSCLVAMVSHYQPANLENLLVEVAQIIAEGKDSHLCHLALDFVTVAVKTLPTGRALVHRVVMEKVLSVSTSVGGVFSGQAYSSLMTLFATMAKAGDFDLLFGELFKPSADVVYWNKIASAGKAQLVAEACAVLVVESGDRRDATIAGIVKEMGATSTAYRHVQLLMVGEIGKRTSLAKYGVDTVLQSAFDSEEEQIRISAAASLGKLVAGDNKVFLPIVMAMLQSAQTTHKKNQYLLLASLKEVLSPKSSSAFLLSAQDLDTIMKVLQSQLDSCPQDEEVRSMIGECLGKLAALQPDLVFPTLVSTPKDSLNASWTKITAMRCAVVAENKDVRQLATCFVPCVGPFLSSAGLDGTKREQTENCKAALFACHALIHHLPAIAVEVFGLAIAPNAKHTLVDVLFEDTKVVAGLQKKVDFGPFKILVDDGLPLRKSAFSCLSSLLDNAQTSKLLGALNTGPLLPCVAAGALDFPENAPDVATICHQILIQVCARSPLSILAHSQVVLKALQDTFTKIKYTPPAAAAAVSSSSTAAAKDEDPEGKERKLSIFRSALRAINAIALVPGALEDRAVADTISMVQKQDYLYKMVQDEGLKGLVKKQ
ncbi:hypothetical protein BASA81_008687 [Batrachochytrium salamandrivorans]|nr:hypothetical protein BASA81_008687 [Batrachochytrium salamandrivorans]